MSSSRYENLPRAYGTMLMAYHVAIHGIDKVIPGCVPGDLTTDPAPFEKMLQGTNGVIQMEIWIEDINACART